MGVMGSGHVQKLNLGDHDVAGVVGGEAAAGPGHLGGVGAGGQDGGFLRGHGDDVILAVDHEVDGHAQGIGIAADDVLDHMVGLVHIQRVGVLENGLFFLGQAAELGHLLHTFLGGKLKESGIAAGFHMAFPPCVIQRWGAVTGYGW